MSAERGLLLVLQMSTLNNVSNHILGPTFGHSCLPSRASEALR